MRKIKSVKNRETQREIKTNRGQSKSIGKIIYEKDLENLKGQKKTIIMKKSTKNERVYVVTRIKKQFGVSNNLN